MRIVSVLAVLVLAVFAAPAGPQAHEPRPLPQRSFGPPPSPPRSLPSPTPSQLPPIVVLSIGDSLTVGADGSTYASYRQELSRLMTLTGQPHTWVVAAVGGSKCSYWASRINGLITTHQPKLIVLNCGTNDTPSDATEADYRTILATAQARGVPIVASLIGRPYMGSPENSVRPWIEGWMDSTNDAIRRALAAYPAVPYASMLRVPNNPEWLHSDGIHLTARSEAAYGQLFYQAAQLIRSGWRTFVQMCGLSGHDRDDPWPVPDVAYRVCWN